MDANRRQLLALGSGVLTGALGGCLQLTDPSEETATENRDVTDTPTPTATPTPSVEDVLDEETLEWLGNEATESFRDRTGSDTATVTVGDADRFEQEFTPAVLRVGTSTTVRWEWTGEGGSHNVVSDGDGPLDSGDVAAGSEATVEYTFEEPGTYRYHCQPHGGLGARGVVVVVSTV